MDIGNSELQRAYDHRYEDIDGDHCEKDKESGAMACLTVRDVGMDCEEEWYDEGYKECRIQFDLSIESNYEGTETFSVNTECTAKFVENGHTFAASNVRAWEEFRFYETEEKWASVEKTLDFDSIDPVTDVELKRPQCRVSSVRQMP